MKTALPPHWAWLPVTERPDVPIRFVHDANPEWQRLAQFWNHDPPLAAGMRTIHLGLAPLAAAAAMVAADVNSVIVVKVPRGLPDPTPLIPAANPPTYGRWQLGAKIFAEPALKVGPDAYSCATCHQPDHGYTQRRSVSVGGAFNTLSLLNVAYNRRQFWDGRVADLEQTLVRALSDEQPGADQDPLATHRWGGLVATLAADRDYRAQFQRVFGIELPTQDAIAKVVATYLRTLLAGDSLYDRAEAERRRLQAPALTPEHFIPFLDDKTLARLGTKLARDEAARRLAQGAALHHGKAHCAACHSGPLFTDHDYHNVGLGENESIPTPGAETGRFAATPIGLKEARLIGAFRTPSLRNLPRTAPYFHNGRAFDLAEVVRFFDLHVDWDNPYLARALREAGDAGRLKLTPAEIEALVLFLQALDGHDP